MGASCGETSTAEGRGALGGPAHPVARGLRTLRPRPIRGHRWPGSAGALPCLGLGLGRGNGGHQPCREAVVLETDRGRGILAGFLQDAAGPLLRGPLPGGGRASPGFDAPPEARSSWLLACRVRPRIAVHREQGVRPRQLPHRRPGARPRERRIAVPARGRRAVASLPQQLRRLPAPGAEHPAPLVAAYETAGPAPLVVGRPLLSTPSPAALAAIARREGIRQGG
mmetsp:Transcript_6852/g.15367  ORF Transcript_6852/g.15367 Transcript_6852/m.15367 type:complete len:225 (+) Transcript_6852:1102-1776(+)